LTAFDDIKRGTVVADVDNSDLQPTSGPIGYLQYQKAGPMDPSAGQAITTAVDGNIQAKLLPDAAPAPTPVNLPAPVSLETSRDVVLPPVRAVKAQSPARVCKTKACKAKAAKAAKSKVSKAKAKKTSKAKATTAKKKKKKPS
jgi:hypothetical protein